MWLPSPFIAPIAAIEMRDATRAYSIAVAPSVQRQILVNRPITHSLVNAAAPILVLRERLCSPPPAETLRDLVNPVGVPRLR